MDDGFIYGNTRLRARKADLLDKAAWPTLVTLDIDGLLAALAETAYRVDVQAALPRFRGERALQEAVRTHVARSLREMRSFYHGPARDQVDLLVGRVDLGNLRTVFRGLARFAPADEVVALLVPGGVLDEAVLRELAVQPGLRAAIDLLIAWGSPWRDVARAMLSSWPAYERTGDPAALEWSLARSWAERLDEELGRGPDPVVRLLRRDIDRMNLLVALRLHRARERGEPARHGDIDAFLVPGGTVNEGLMKAAAAVDRAAVLAALAPAPLPPQWRDALRAWERHGDLPGLAGALDGLLTRDATSLFVTGDPLDISVPVAFLWAKENEARNLRLIGAGIVAGHPPELTLGDLVLVP